MRAIHLLALHLVVLLLHLHCSDGQGQGGQGGGQGGGPLLFPYPLAVEYGEGVWAVSPASFNISSDSPSSLLHAAIERYEQLVFPFSVASPYESTFSSLDVVVKSTSEDLQLGVDESYTLTVTGSSNVLTAVTIFGAMRGLETFSQLVSWNYYVGYLPITIKDAPRFEWRGLMIDTARHFLSVNTILRAIDAAAYNKMNTLHWHALDAESFPIQSTAYPRLAQLGAYAPQAIYSTSDVRSIVQYGLERGIRVVLELDMPGHAYSWGKGYSNLTTTCPKFAENINNIPLDPSNPFVYKVLAGVIAEMAALFPDNTFHVGGDEVIFDCWLQNTAVLEWMTKMNFQGGPEILQYMEMAIMGILEKNNRTMVCWQELFQNGVTLKQDTIIEVWEEFGTLQEVVDGGYRGLVAFPYYMDKQIPKAGVTHYEWVDTWHDFYNSDPYDNITGNNLHNIIGGEAVMFGEQVDSVNFDSRVWPRACGVSERLWSPATVTNITTAITRLVSFRCRMAQRGIGAGPIAPDYCPMPNI